MGLSRRASVVLAVMMSVPSLGLSGCGSDDDPSAEAPAEDAGQKARERVQIYLDAMKAKDVQAGRGQFCEAMRDSFDKAATGPNGDFAEHFTVSEASIADARANGGKQEVDAAVTVSIGERDLPVNLRFTVARSSGEWCIADERQADPVTPSPAPSPSPS